MTAPQPFGTLANVSSTEPKQQVIESTLGQPVGPWIMERRSHRYAPSWRQLADELEELTGVRVSHESVRQWALDAMSA